MLRRVTQPLKILHSDAHMVAIDKPAGLAVHRGWAKDPDYAMTRLRDQLGQWVYPVHRLDRGTSGVLLFALSSQDARTLSAFFEGGTVIKRYLGLVRGAPPEHLILDYALVPDNGGARQPAVTELRRLAQYGRYALVEALPRTGRLHQIRRHLKHLSCPLIGDVRYGKGEHNRFFRTEYQLTRLALHCSSLTLESLALPRLLTIEAPLPPDMANTIERLAAGPTE